MEEEAVAEPESSELEGDSPYEPAPTKAKAKASAAKKRPAAKPKAAAKTKAKPKTKKSSGKRDADSVFIVDDDDFSDEFMEDDFDLDYDIPARPAKRRKTAA